MYLSHLFSQCAAAVMDTTQKTDFTGLVVKTLQQATEQGYKDVVYLQSEPDFDTLQEHPDFLKLLAGMKQSDSAALYSPFPLFSSSQLSTASRIVKMTSAHHTRAASSTPKSSHTQALLLSYSFRDVVHISTPWQCHSAG